MAVVLHLGSECTVILRSVLALITGTTESEYRLTFQVRSDTLHQASDTAVEFFFLASDNGPKLFECTDEISVYDLVNVIIPVLPLTISFVRALVLAEREVVAVVFGSPLV